MALATTIKKKFEPVWNITKLELFKNNVDETFKAVKEKLVDTTLQ